MRVPKIIACFALGAAAINPPDETLQAADKNLPGLNAVQTRYALAIINGAKEDGVGLHGCQAAIATALVESSLVMYANKNVPESLKHPHDRVGSERDAVGLFQQRASIYKSIRCSMDAACSADQFYTEMKKVQGWQSMPVGALCQKVQRSTYPDRYTKQSGIAMKVCSAGGF
ncbi:NLP/P60 protein [Fusarium austroafricanum]|uniref:NLP/P60 protein n=1 Tax=Fusarium austroafricanum TaxID=2364996 RepID=A0A8H4KXW3_9HYPO|nr:NLP/P60 protein [Fusarium austroafricanum]